MSPVAVFPTASSHLADVSAKSDHLVSNRPPLSSPTVSDISRRPSPWHEIAHSLSATPVSRRASSPNIAAPPPTLPPPIPIDQPVLDAATTPPLALSSSQALREWEERLMSPDTDVQRHQLVHPSTSSFPTPPLGPAVGSHSPQVLALPPKLAAERDKEGHIEYKLKLIDPSPERFGRLVTQMMWRLKQGKNEAIYELGLADDGTVVGLTRAEMDASLRTLELMASEVGATVMILREIVLSGQPPTTGPRDSPALSDADISSSSIISLSSSAHSSNDGAEYYRWPVRRPDLDAQGLPRKGTKTLGDPDNLKLAKKPSKEVVKGQFRPGRQVIFETCDLEEGDTDTDIEGHGRSSGSSSRSYGASRSHRNTDDDIPPFHLDLDEPSLSTRDSRHRRRNRKQVDEASAQAERETMSRKSNAKRLRLAQKREARRLDLLRGDGMSPHWIDTAPSANSNSTAPTSSTNLQPHQPARPSSLRLSAAPPERTSDDAAEDESLWSLSQTPLDSLSLSFANVQIEPSSPPSSPSSDTEYAMPLHDDHDDEASSAGDGDGNQPVSAIGRPLTGEEMICVEALVVRKVQHGHGADGDEPEEEECGWGGDDDGWGFGVDED